ncbi:Piso0_000740 [Millerozyma farinosa CBS 7064]|uniref:DNA replication complex GINS protein PSF2 n=1 Tax=Pichia sorbitophila (strain ATCC MYA-4447 / BCRC 22081 / CBS 7064 / NBRC 10061 / NRRL Y-12695) TaxID=559304 RepID=G8YPX6_PICSO|nr:Piso0_000740 [Millerozyma farinosa CBS 7064]
MALPESLTYNLSPPEISFLSENEYITILPRYSMKKIELIGEKIPTLRGMRRERVPLWVALILKSQDKCNIVPPSWLELDFLKMKYEEEMKLPHKFSALPWHWLEISKILLAKAPDDLADPSNKLKSIIQDLREIRLVKSRKGLKELNESNIQLDGLSFMEINELRPYILKVMDKLMNLHDSISRNNVEAETNENEYEDGEASEDE